MAIVEEDLSVEISKIQPKALEIDDELVSLAGPVKTPATGEYPVPADSDFGTQEFMYEKDLAELGDWLIKHKVALVHLNDVDVHYRWKRKGGESGDRENYFKTSKTSGLLRQYSQADFVIWLAADNCRGMTKHEVEATLFAALCYATVDQNGKPQIAPPDLHTHIAVIREYGAVTPAIRAAQYAFKQIAMNL